MMQNNRFSYRHQTGLKKLPERKIQSQRCLCSFDGPRGRRQRTNTCASNSLLFLHHKFRCLERQPRKEKCLVILLQGSQQRLILPCIACAFLAVLLEYKTKGWPNGLFLEHLNELFQPVRNFFNQCPFHMLIRISLCVPHKNVILEPFTKPCHENATQECLLMVNNLLISTEQSTTSWKKLLIDMAEKN